MSTIKIAYVIDTLGIGGTEKQLVSLINGLDRSRFEPYLVCLKENKGPILDMIECPVHHFPMRKIISFSGYTAWRTMARFFAEKRIDIVQTFFFDSTVIGILAAEKSRVPVKISSRRDLGFKTTPREWLGYRFLNTKTGCIIVNSQAIKEITLTKEHVRDEARVVVIPNGIAGIPSSDACQKMREESRKKWNIPPGFLTVGIVSNMNRHVKRVDLFVEVARLVAQQEKKVRFLIVGEGYLRKELELQVNRYGLFDVVKFMGSLADPMPAICGFDIGMNTSDSEGFSNSVIECMMCGVPVVATDNAGNSELVCHEKTGLLAPCGNAEALARQVIRYIDDPVFRSRMRDEGEKYARLEFTCENMIEKHEMLYERLRKAKG